MYAIMQTRFKPSDSSLSGNHHFGIASKTTGYTNLSGPINIRFDDLAKPLKELPKSEFQELNVGFYLILE